MEQGYENVLPQRTLAAIQAHKVALKGPVTTPVGKGFRSVNVQLRKKLNLYAAVRPVRSMPGVKTRYENVDMVIVRENTEGLYSGIENEVVPGVVTSLKVASEAACTRIAALCVPLRHPPPPQEDHGLPQGQHHEADRWAVPELRPADPRGGISRTSNTRK